MTLTAIGIPQISGECPYKVLNSQRVPTRREANERNERDNVTQTWTGSFISDVFTALGEYVRDYCDAVASSSGWNFGSKIPVYPPPPKI